MNVMVRFVHTAKLFTFSETTTAEKKNIVNQSGFKLHCDLHFWMNDAFQVIIIIGVHEVVYLCSIGTAEKKKFVIFFATY